MADPARRPRSGSWMAIGGPGWTRGPSHHQAPAEGRRALGRHEVALLAWMHEAAYRGAADTAMPDRTSHGAGARYDVVVVGCGRSAGAAGVRVGGATAGGAQVGGRPRREALLLRAPIYSAPSETTSLMFTCDSPESPCCCTRLSVELSRYLPLLLKLVVVVYAVLCLGEFLHRWSSGDCCLLSSGAPEQQAAKAGATLQCSAVLGANRWLMMQMQSSSSTAAAPSKKQMTLLLNQKVLEMIL